MPNINFRRRFLLSGGAQLHDGLSANFLTQSFYTRPSGGGVTRFANAQSLYSWSSSTKWTRNAAGILIASGANTPGYDFSFGGSPLGVLLEDARTNYVLQANNLGTTWVNQNATRETDVGTSPDGTVNADRFRGIGISTAQGVQQGAVTVPSGAQLTASVFLKNETTQFVTFGVYDSAWRQANFDIQNGIVNASGAGVSAAVLPFANGWYRFPVTYTITGTSAFTGPFLSSLSSNTVPDIYTAGTSATSLFSYAQLEVGPSASSIIPTTTGSVTRNADVVSRTLGTEFSATAGTAIICFSVPSIASSSSDRVIYEISDGTANERFRLVIPASSNFPRFIVTDGGAAQCSIDGPAITAGSIVKAAIAWSANDFQFVVNGVSQGTDTSGTLPTVTTETLGAGPSGTNGLFGHILTLDRYPTRLPVAQMIGLTS
jgi:hypothetical protein